MNWLVLGSHESVASLCGLVWFQTLLKQTDAEHPDYYLLLVCIQQVRAFTTQYAHLLQHNKELLLHNRKELKRSASDPGSDLVFW